ncbi:hypothetical protein Selin_0137 [Desulfurispirillum indicum S5]|uniref:Uncharacterized protein n=1 Tax=Desulfurispirillum indicum (strain ATCC BAA-1389 / DSM 22839 / S5) TaxID=653733 RepID=E6W5G4_DESIS|nr:hypothetical protein Selin_0137 [Desulfurispirillum indicum S5]
MSNAADEAFQQPDSRRVLAGKVHGGETEADSSPLSPSGECDAWLARPEGTLTGSEWSGSTAGMQGSGNAKRPRCKARAKRERRRTSLYVAVTSDALQRSRWASLSSLLPDLQNRRANEPEKRAFGGRVFGSFLRGQKGQYPETKSGIPDKSSIQNQYGFRDINVRIITP